MLTELQIKAAKPKEKAYYLSDGRGLILMVKPNGSKCWIARIYAGGKERRRGLGTWPAVSLKQARDLCVDTKRAGDEIIAPKLEEIAERWYSTQITGRSSSHQYEMRIYLERHIIPALGGLRVNAITPAQCLDLCQSICDAGHLNAARLARQILVRVLDFAVVAGYIPANPASAIRRVLPSPAERHLPALSEPEDIALLMQRLEKVPRPLIRAYLLILVYTFCRPAELAGARWSEFDGDMWTIPAGRMKGRRAHVVPLAPQVLAILKDLKTRNYSDVLLFPGQRGDKAPFSADVPRRALMACGYTPAEISLHGFRAMASTVLNGAGFSSDVIEAQLAHVDRNKVRRAYNRAEYLPQRVELMRWYADFLDKIKAGS